MHANLRHNWSSTIFRGGTRLAELTYDFAIEVPSRLRTSGYVNFAHRGGQDGIVADMPVAVSARVGIRHAANSSDMPTFPTGARTAPLWNVTHPNTTFRWIPGAKDGKNIINLRHHYETCLLLSCIDLMEPGAYRVEAWAFANVSAAYPSMCTRDDIVEVNRDSNQSNDNTFGFMAVDVAEIN
ncbi:hypothetical protein RHAB21_02506 [Pseudorhizobium halotolerans]|uniref:Uncharacterized protein n=1 Tax=Pseudorhizobium halotolerans TaxID=1233081 RepID=A0ABN7JPL7_9HYPH|nr:hypothetical protein [Pseudorhizobium halotolerans]CAD7036291.1 hypothetical protein RHAB21_02506 [Pseudorhizobium halotolerans]